MSSDLERLLHGTAVAPLEPVDVEAVVARAGQHRRRQRVGASLAAAAFGLAIATGISMVVETPAPAPIIDTPEADLGPGEPERGRLEREPVTELPTGTEEASADRLVAAPLPREAPEDAQRTTPSPAETAPPGQASRDDESGDDDPASPAEVRRSEATSWSFERGRGEWSDGRGAWSPGEGSVGAGLAAYRPGQADEAAGAASITPSSEVVSTSSPRVELPAWATHVEVELSYRYARAYGAATMTLGAHRGSNDGGPSVGSGFESERVDLRRSEPLGTWRMMRHRVAVADLVTVGGDGVTFVRVGLGVAYPSEDHTPEGCPDRTVGGPCDLGFVFDEVTVRFLAE